MKSSHVLKMAMLKGKDQEYHVDTLTTSKMKNAASSFKIDQLKKRNSSFILNLEFIGMPYY